MPRPGTGKTHVGERRERRKNGDVYVYERVTAYNPETRKTETVSERLKGKIKAGETAIVATRPKRRGGDAPPDATRRRTGTADILQWVGAESGIDRDVLGSFARGDAEKMLSIARYLVATGGNSLARMEAWQVMHEMPYAEGISEDVYCELFGRVGRDESGIQDYFARRASALSSSPVLAFDSTTISTYSENQSEARQGFNKDRDGLDTIKLLTLYSVKDREPIAFAKQPGNIPDVISVENALKQVRCLGLDKPMIVTDNGYYSHDNMMEFALRNMKFLMLADPDVKWVRSVVDSLRDEVAKASRICPFDIRVRGESTSLMHDFTRTRKRSRNGVAAGAQERFSRRLYVHVFFSQDNAGKRQAAFDKSLVELKSQLEAGEDDFTAAARKKIEKYLLVSRLGRGGRVKVTFNEDAVAEAYRYFGYFALVGNQPLETFEALEDYRLREKIEEAFADQKGTLGARRPRAWYPDNLKGRLFTQFIALGYLCHLQKRLKQVRASLAKDADSMTKEQFNLETRLARWLDEHSLAQILDWFDCIETTAVRTPAGMVRWSTESVARDRLLLNRLGVTRE